MTNNMSDNLKRFFYCYSKKRRIQLYQVLVSDLVNISAQTSMVESEDSFNSLKHQFKGICRYLYLELDTQIDVMTNPEQLLYAVDNIYVQVIAMEHVLYT